MLIALLYQAVVGLAIDIDEPDVWDSLGSLPSSPVTHSPILVILPYKAYTKPVHAYIYFGIEMNNASARVVKDR